MAQSVRPVNRLLAVLCLKNAVSRRWHQRRQGESAIADAEKAVLRRGLLHTLDEQDPQIWAQLELLIATIGRLDGLSAWPELMPTSSQGSSREPWEAQIRFSMFAVC